MAKAKTIFYCQECGGQSAKWLGKCPDCQAWNSFVEEKIAGSSAHEERRLVPSETRTNRPIPLPQVDTAQHTARPTGIAELDRVLGGGIVPSSMVLLGGDPGIGKSTLVLQTLARCATKQAPVLYVTAEESSAQVRLRAERLGAGDNEHLYILTENSVEAILRAIDELKPALCVVDSIQTIYTDAVTSAPGTVSQLRETASRLLYASKAGQTATLLIGHVTKDGAIAGPKVLEHMVDTVLYFEGERGHQFRILRGVKNRFGSTNEIGVFEMTGTGLHEVANPSALFLAERPAAAPGSVVVVPMEGTRPLLVEVQALVTSSGLGNPRRTAIGVDTSRVSLLIAVLEKVVGLQLSDHDTFINVAGGLRMKETGIDLGVIMAIASSFKDKPVDPQCIFLGEVGLTGEIRAVSTLDARLAEAHKLGFTKAVVPASQIKTKAPRGMEVMGMANVTRAMDLI